MAPARRPYPSIPAVVFTIWALVVPLLFANRMLNADGDLLRHLRHGAWMLQHRSLIHADPFSYTKGGEPFLAFEYGSQLVYTLVHGASGLAGVAIFAGLLIAASYAVIARFLLGRGADPLLAYLVSIAAAILGAVHWAARPHLFTLLGVALLLFYLEPGDKRPRLWVLVPFFAIWANLHGGFVYGLTLLLIYFAGSLAERWLGAAREIWSERARYYGRALALAGLGTLLNPNGIQLHLHIIQFFGEPFLRDNTSEFMSPDFHSAGGQMLLVALVGILAPFALGPGRPTGPRLLLMLANVAFALQARRNSQLFAASVFPVLALHFDAAWRARVDWRGIRAVFERDARRGSDAVFIAVVSGLLLAIALQRGRVGPFELVPDQLDSEEFPIAIVDQARAEGVQGRIFHEFIWGGYLLYAWPDQKVFIDGGTDFYGPDLMAAYLDVIQLRPGWRDTLANRNISLVLMPTKSAMVNELARDGEWRLRSCDATAALLERGSGGEGAVAVERLVTCLNSGRRGGPVVSHPGKDG
ncbi:MAG: hypothetical protein ACREMX_00405 [Gemmatimonadales bacterium]